jgi:hypothetical protein
METVSIKKLFIVLIAFSAVMLIVSEYSWVSLITTMQSASAVQQFSSTLHRNNQLNAFGNLNASSNPNQFNIRSNVNPFPNLPSPGTSSPSTSSLSQSQFPYQYPYSYGYQSQPSSSPVTPQGSSQLQSQSQNQYPYPYQQGQQAQQPQQQPLQTSPQVSSTAQSQRPTQIQSSAIPSVTNPSQYQLQQPQQQNQSSSSLTNAAQYPYQSQQPQSSQSFSTGQPSVSTLIIVTHVNSTGSNNEANAANNFTQIVENTFTNPDGYANVYHYMKGSQIGVTLSLQPGGFSVYELNKNLKSSNQPPNQSTYDINYSGDCRTVKSDTGSTTYGYGTINLGETKTCTVTLSLHK